MRRVLFLLLLLSWFPAVHAGDVHQAVPDWAKFFPANTLLIVGVRDFSSSIGSLIDVPQEEHTGISLYNIVDKSESEYREPILKAFADISGFASYFPRGFAAALVGPSLDDLSLFIIAPMKKEDLGFTDYLEITFLPLLDKIFGPAEVSLDGDLFVITFGTNEEGAFKIYYTIADDRLYASSDPRILRDAIENPPVKDLSLYADPTFADFCRVIRSSGLIAYFNSARFSEMAMKNMGRHGTKVYTALGLNHVKCIGLSIGQTKSHLIIDLALIFSDTYEGLPRMIFQPDLTSSAIQFVPKDYSLFFSLSTGDAAAAWYAWKDAVRKMVDDIGWTEYLLCLNDWDAKHGLLFEKEIIENLGDEVAAAIRFPNEFRAPDILLLAKVKNKKLAVQTIQNVLEKKELNLIEQKLNEKGDLLCSFYIGEKQFAWTFKGKYLIAAQGADLVKEALRTWETEESLDTDKTYRSIESSVPDGHVAFMYIDEKKLNEFALFWLESLLNKPDDGSAETSEESLVEEILDEDGPFDEGDTEEQEIGTVQKYLYKIATDDFIKSTRELFGKTAKGLSATTFTARINGDALTISTSISIEEIDYLLKVATHETLQRMIKESRDRARLALRGSNIKQIVLAAMQYAMDNKKKLPEKPSQLYPTYVSGLELFKSPYSRETITPQNLDATSHYVLVGGLKMGMPAETIIMYEKKAPDDATVWAGFVDGHTKMITVEELNQLLAQQRRSREQGQ